MRRTVSHNRVVRNGSQPKVVNKLMHFLPSSRWVNNALRHVDVVRTTVEVAEGSEERVFPLIEYLPVFSQNLKASQWTARNRENVLWWVIGKGQAGWITTTFALKSCGTQCVSNTWLFAFLKDENPHQSALIQFSSQLKHFLKDLENFSSTCFYSIHHWLKFFFLTPPRGKTKINAFRNSCCFFNATVPFGNLTHRGESKTKTLFLDALGAN